MMATLVSISAANANDIFAVGSVGEGEHPSAAALQFNGTTWSAVANGPSGTHSVDAISATDVWVVGGAGGSTGAAVWNFNGTTWTEVFTFPGQATAVSGSLSNDVYVVGEGDLVEQWNGTSFNVVSATGTAGFTGVATLSNGTAFAVGGNGIEEATTSIPTTTIPTTTALTSSASSAPFGGSVTLTATITPSSTGSAAPTGSVAFFDGSTLIGGGDVSGDVATLVTTSLPVGTNSITATYEGDSNYAVSTSTGRLGDHHAGDDVHLGFLLAGVAGPGPGRDPDGGHHADDHRPGRAERHRRVLRRLDPAGQRDRLGRLGHARHHRLARRHQHAHRDV